MQYGFIKMAAVTPDIRVSDCTYNALQINKKIDQAAQNNIKILVLPELCVTGCTCADLFLQDVLLNAAEEALLAVLAHSANLDMLITVGLPIRFNHMIYNCAAVLHKGKILGITPQIMPANKYGFTFSAFGQDKKTQTLNIRGHVVPFGANLLFKCNALLDLIIGVELSDDVLLPVAPSVHLCAAGATVILNPSSNAETISGAQPNRECVKSHSARLHAAYVVAMAGYGESSTDYVFAGQNFIIENGSLLCENQPFDQNNLVITEIDCGRLQYLRRKNQMYNKTFFDFSYTFIEFSFLLLETKLTRKYATLPFIDKHQSCEESEHIISIQAHALKKRMLHTNSKKAVLGVSGGLDSTLALIATARAMEIMKRATSEIIAVTMPCFGTTKRTKTNAEKLCQALKIPCKTIDITQTVNSHFKDIEQSVQNKDAAYENAQARIRTLVLMDIANQCGGMVIGTGDLSELALGWCTYNGDHMSMYSLNASLPKTLIRFVLSALAQSCEDSNLKDVLLDILDTPVSPELLPAENNEIVQETEELIGPYELHDFFLYHLLQSGYTPEKILHVAKYTFAYIYDESTIKKWFRIFCRRFFSQQFKRSCMPDGPKISEISLSPREGFSMASDVSDTIFNEWE